MARLSDADRRVLINAIATKEGTAQELSDRYGYSIKFLRSFVDRHRQDIELVREEYEAKENALSTTDTEPTPIDLERLWIANKTARLKRLQEVADLTYKEVMAGSLSAAEYATALREFRSYCLAASNELGQLMHRGAGDSTTDTLSVDIQGVDFENLK